MRQFWPAAIAICLAVVTFGCSLSRPSQVASSAAPAADAAAQTAATTQPATTNPATTPTAATPATNPAASALAAPGATGGAANPDPKALAEVLGELQSLGAIDPATQARLIDDMKKTDPALWPQIVQVFRASIAYRQQQEKLQAQRKQGVIPGSHSPQFADRPLVGLPNQAAMDGQPRPVPDTTDSALPPAVTPSGNYPSTGMAPLSSGEIQQVTAVAPEKGAPRDQRTAARAEPVARTDASPAPPRDWNQNLSETIRNLEAETQGAPQSSADVNRQATLRMLYLMAGRRDDALRPITGATAAQQDFWSKEMFGLATYLDVERVPDATRRASEATLHLRDAATKLGEQAGLQLRNLSFCSEVNSYGVYKKFDSLEFAPGQQLLLYVEVDNFRSESTDKGFHTSLKTSYQILDSRGARVDDKEFAATEEYCGNPRRDYFLRYFIFVPKRIYNGKYTLQLTVEDTKSQKIGQSSIDFTVKEKQ
jgi:hypothetical protein